MKISLKFLVASVAWSMSAATSAPVRAQTATENRAAPIIRADQDFARLADASGVEKAFDAYYAAGAINPMAGEEKAVDRAGMLQRMKKLDANGLKLSWKLTGGDLASSGDFGYTYGKWELTKKDGGESIGHGFYATVWKKGADGSWKAEFDIGNEAAEGK